MLRSLRQRLQKTHFPRVVGKALDLFNQDYRLANKLAPAVKPLQASIKG
jgi:hypothetical protein